MVSPLASKHLSAIGMAGVAHARTFLASKDQQTFLEDMTRGLREEQREVYLLNLASAVFYRRRTLVDSARGYLSGNFNATQKKQMEKELISLTPEKVAAALKLVVAGRSKKAQ